MISGVLFRVRVPRRAGLGSVPLKPWNGSFAVRTQPTQRLERMASMCCRCGQYGLVPFFIYCRLHTPAFFYSIAHTCMNPTVFVHGVRRPGWCDHQPRRRWGPLASSLHRVNLRTRFVAIVDRDTVPRCGGMRKGKRKGSVGTDLEPIIKTVRKRLNDRVFFFTLHHLFITLASHLQPKHY